MSTGRPTYWPTDLNKKPDLPDFAVTRELNTNKLKIIPNLELSSDHTPITIEYRNKPILYSKPETLCNKTTKWQTLKEIIESKINCNIPLKTPEKPKLYIYIYIYVGDERTPEPSLWNFDKTPSTVI